MGAFRTSPTINTLSEAIEAPLKIRRMHLSIKFAAKIASTPQNPVLLNIFRQNGTTIIHSTKKTTFPFYIRVSHYDHYLNTNLKTNSATPRNLPNVPPWTIPKITIDTDLLKYDKKQTNQHIQTFVLRTSPKIPRPYTHLYRWLKNSKWHWIRDRR